ncbi:MAG TPA: hypothetical protein VEG08_10075 [Terriglobales bacterium]|nr:hypothetical protein [Terriglobales bacterium]
MRAKDILRLLGGGDRRSLGRCEEVAAMVARQPRLLSALMAGLWSEDLVVRMRAADAIEKVTRAAPGLLRRYKRELLGLLAEAEQAEVRWHLAAMVPRLPLSPAECRHAASLLQLYLDDRSSIVKTFALQGLSDLAQQEPSLRGSVLELLRQSVRNGTPAMKARSRKLLARLEEE